jgi:hypothetical protein
MRAVGRRAARPGHDGADCHGAGVGVRETRAAGADKGREETQDHPMKTVWVYDKAWHGRKSEEPLRIGDEDWIKIFATKDDANRWIEQNDPEGVAWEYPVEAVTKRADGA